MAIVLTQYEKHALFRFLSIYAISLVVLVSLIASLVFMIQREQLHQNIQNQMLLKSSKIAQMAISEHMGGQTRLNSNFLDFILDLAVEVTLFDKDKNVLYGLGQFPKQQEKFSIFQNRAILLDDGAYGHLGIEWILLEVDFEKQIHSLLFYISAVSILCFVFVAIFGLILGKLFLKPVRDGVAFLDDFIKDVTHELNTPISALVMSVGSLKNGVSEQKLSRIYKACKRIEFLYSNLTFLFLGELCRIKERFEFLELLKNRIEMFEDLLREKKISLIFLQQEKIYCYADKEGVICMIDNLLSNAIKHSENEGEIFITLNPRCFCIQNSGKSIPDHLIEQIKKRYVRANFKARGYGIGLDIIQKVATFHQWELHISRKDDLNTFEIFFDSTLAPH